MTGLLVEIPEVEVEIGHDGRSSFAYSRNVFNDGGAGEKLSSDNGQARTNKPDNAFPGARYDNQRM